MTIKQARQLLLHAVVMWDGNKNDLGTVCKLGKGGFLVDWADRERLWYSYHDAKRIEIR